MVSKSCSFHIDTSIPSMSTLRLLLSSQQEIFVLLILLSYLLYFGLTTFQLLCTRRISQEKLSTFQPMKNSTLLIIQVLLEFVLDEVYGVILNDLLKLNSNSCCRNIYLYDDACVMVLIQFEVLSQLPPSQESVSNMVNVFLYSHKSLTIFHQGAFLQQPINITPFNSIFLIHFVVYLLVPCDGIYYRGRTNTSIHISISFINNDWINDT